MTTFGERLRQLRLAAGLSQAELAGGDLSSSYISLMEAGKRSPSSEVVQQLAARLGCSTTQLVEGKPSERDERIDLELAFARLAVEHGESAEARSRLERLLAEDGLPQRVRDDIGFLLGIACDRSGDLPAAVRVFAPLFQRARHGQTHLLVTLLGLGLCGFSLRSGDLTRAVQVGEEALEAAQRQGLAGTDDYYRLAATLMQAYVVRGDLTHARIWAEQFLEQAQVDDRPAGQAAIYWNLALLAEREGRLAEARHLCEQALGRLSELDSSLDYALLRLEVAVVLLNDDPPQLTRAVDLLDRCREDLTDLGAPTDLGAWHRAMSTALLLRGDVVEAEILARRAVDLSRDDPEIHADAWQALGDALAAQHRDADAEEATRCAFAALSQAPSVRLLALKWRELGERMAADGDAAGAIAAFRRALDSAGAPDRGLTRRLHVAALRERPPVPAESERVTS